MEVKICADGNEGVIVVQENDRLCDVKKKVSEAVSWHLEEYHLVTDMHSSLALCDNTLHALSYGDTLHVVATQRDISLAHLSSAGIAPCADALCEAARRGDTDIVCHLLETGLVQVDTAVGGKSALFISSARGHEGVVAALLERGGHPDVGRRSALVGDTTPLGIAVDRKQVGCARLLLAHGADVDGVAGGKGLPLFTACTNGDVEMTELLLSAGADPDIRFRGKTAKQVAPMRSALRPIFARLNNATKNQPKSCKTNTRSHRMRKWEGAVC